MKYYAYIIFFLLSFSLLGEEYSGNNINNHNQAEQMKTSSFDQDQIAIQGLLEKI